MKIEVQTCSYSGDFEICRTLCETMDRFAPADMRHLLLVPAAETAMFSVFARPGREIRAQQDFLPSWLHRLPLPKGAWRRLLMLPRRDVFVSLRCPPVRGWIAQQIIKIAAARDTDADIVVHIDSDSAFVRPFAAALFHADGKVRCYRHPDAPHPPSHVPWHEAASTLFGLPPSPNHGADYIDGLVPWRVGTVRSMTDRIEEVAGRDWRLALASTRHFSEYILYGVFCDKVAEASAATAGKLDYTSTSLSHTLWTGSLANETDRKRFIAELQPHHISCLIQSTLDVPGAARDEVIAALIARAAEQDAPGPA